MFRLLKQIPNHKFDLFAPLLEQLTLNLIADF